VGAAFGVSGWGVITPNGVPGGGTKGTPNLFSALVLLFSNRNLSSALIVVCAVSAWSLARISSNARLFGDSASPFFFGGSRSFMRDGWALGLPELADESATGGLSFITRLNCGAGATGVVGLWRVLWLTDEMEACFRDFRDVDFGLAEDGCTNGDAERLRGGNDVFEGLRMSDGALLFSMDGGRHSGQSGRSGGSL
jgi:hypothetical protein